MNSTNSKDKMKFQEFLNISEDEVDAIITDIQEQYHLKDFDEACCYVTYLGILLCLSKMDDENNNTNNTDISLN